MNQYLGYEAVPGTSLFHLGLTFSSHTLTNLHSDFGQISHVIVCGSRYRAQKLAHTLATRFLKVAIPKGLDICNLSTTDRYALFRISDHVLVASHGIGASSTSVLLNEIAKLLHFSKSYHQINLIRIGTCGALGIPPGSVIISTECVNGALEPVYHKYILGKQVAIPTSLEDTPLFNSFRFFVSSKLNNFSYKVIFGKTLCAQDFYESQARTDGAMCPFTKEEAVAFLQHAHDQGVRNIEMESQAIAEFANQLPNWNALVIAVSLINRLEGDTIAASKQQIAEYEARVIDLLGEYLKDVIHTTTRPTSPPF